MRPNEQIVLYEMLNLYEIICHRKRICVKTRSMRTVKGLNERCSWVQAAGFQPLLEYLIEAEQVVLFVLTLSCCYLCAENAWCKITSSCTVEGVFQFVFIVYFWWWDRWTVFSGISAAFLSSVQTNTSLICTFSPFTSIFLCLKQ